MALKQGRGSRIPSFLAMDVVAAAETLAATLPPEAPGLIRMEVGQPGRGAPRDAVAAAHRLLDASTAAGGPSLGYTQAFGLPALRHRIVRHLADLHDVEVSAERICITTGASGGFVLAFLAAFDPGDRIALASPYYPPYVNILTALGMEPVVLPCGPETDFQPTVAMLAALDPPPDGLILASPCNPAGTMLGAHAFADIAVWCARHGVRVISDEIYHGLHYGPTPATASAMEEAITINSFSKYWRMTGWRVGWMVLPDDLLRAVERLAQNLFISPPHLAQCVALAAMDCTDELEADRLAYRATRDDLRARLPAIGLDRLSSAEGGFYLYADLAALDADPALRDSRVFCRRLLEEAHVAATPGIDFDPVRGHDFVRFSYCGPTALMREVPDRIGRFLGRG